MLYIPAARLLLDGEWCGDTHEEHLRNLILTSSDVGEVVTQLQQELFTLRAQVAAESGLAVEVWAINHFAMTPSLVDVKGLGRPKEFCGKEEDVQQRSKKTDAFFVGVIMDSEMMLGVGS